MKFRNSLFWTNLATLGLTVLLVSLGHSIYTLGFIDDLMTRNARLELDRVLERCALEHQTLVNLGIADTEFYRRNTQQKVIDWVSSTQGQNIILGIRAGGATLVPLEARVREDQVQAAEFTPWEWTILASPSPGQLEEISRRIISTSLSIFFVVLAISTWMLFLLGRGISRPVQMLAQAAQAMGQGDLKARMASVGTDEFRDLSQVFNTMASNLENLTARLEERLQVSNAALDQTKKDLLEKERMAGLGSLVARVTHEVHSPLGSSITIASYLSDRSEAIHQSYTKGNLTKQDFEDLIQDVRENSQSLLIHLTRSSDLIGSFKELAVDQTAGRQRIILLDQYINTIMKSLQHRMTQQKVALETDLAGGLELYLEPGALYQIISNLVNNSLIHAFDQAGGLISIRTQGIGNQVELIYADNGRGMASETQARMYEPFWSTRHDQGGSGLGMHIVLSLVHDTLGGSISCESSPGQGVRFIIRFPKGSVPSQ